jgi:hypothetical protein
MAAEKSDAKDAFSVFVANNSDQAIASCTLKWEILLPDGRTITRYKTKTGELDIVSEGGVTHLSEGIATKGHLLFSLMDSSHPDNSAQTGIEFREGGGAPDLNAQLSDSVKVKVSIDGALFVDGTYVGPDSNNYFELFRGKVEGNRELNEEIAQLIDAGAKPEVIIGHLQRVANVRSSEVKSPAGEVPQYLFGKWMQKNSYARLLLAMGKYKGDQAVLDRVRTEMSKPQIKMRRLKES